MQVVSEEEVDERRLSLLVVPQGSSAQAGVEKTARVQTIISKLPKESLLDTMLNPQGTPSAKYLDVCF